MEEKNNHNNSNRNTINRRKLLAGTAAAGLGLGSLTVSGAAENSSDILNGESLEGRDWSVALREAISDDRFEHLSSEFSASGYRRNLSNASVRKATDKDGTSYRTVVVPFETGNSDEQAYVFWSDLAELGVHSDHFSHEGGSEWNVTTTAADAESGDLSAAGTDFNAESDSIDASELVGSDVSASSECDWQWGCVLQIVGEANVTIAACNDCQWPYWWNRNDCLACVGQVQQIIGSNLERRCCQ